VIVAEQLSKFYGERQALKDVSFNIEDHEVVGFLGLNGAGKTTVLKILSGLLLPSAGKVHVDGLDILEQPREVRRRIGFLPEQPPLYGDMTVRQYLTFAGRLNGLNAAGVARRMPEVLEQTQLARVADDMVSWLSQGYRQRLGIAQAIIHQPALVILDEPITGLDPKQIVGMRGLIRALGEQYTVLLSSHILSEISQTCDRILLLHEGQIVARGSEADLTSHAAAARVQVVLRGGAEEARAVADKTEGISEVTVEAMEGEIVKLFADVEGLAAREALIAALVGAGFGVRRFAEAEAGLEAVFLQMTGAAAVAARAEGGEA